MKAITQDSYGTAAALRLRSIDRPRIAPDEVLLRVRAAGVDRGVVHLMTGLPLVVRLVSGLRTPKNPVPGLDVAGVVEEVGAQVTRFEPGDEVFGIAKGSFAEYASAAEGKLAPKPANLSFEQAAAVAISGLTALQGVRDQARVKPGDRVLVVGASGGVGSFAVQVAKAFGAHVTGVCRTSKTDMVRSIGADSVIDYTTQDFASNEGTYDVILDIGGNSSLTRLRRALTADGTLVITGGEGGGRLIGGTDRQLRAMALSPFVGQKLRSFISSENHRDVLALKELIESHQVTPVVDRTFALSQTQEAIEYLETGEAAGKVVITV